MLLKIAKAPWASEAQLAISRQVRTLTALMLVILHRCMLCNVSYLTSVLLLHCSEYGTSGKVSTYGDTYSFGITLLEIFVGKAPTSDAFRDGLMLTEFVSAAFPDKIEQVLDPALLLEEELFFRVMSPSEEENNGLCVTVYDCLVSAIRVALSCCRQEPCQRMVMRDAAAELCLIRDAFILAYG